MLKSIKIGGLEIKNNVFLAPMAGVTDLPFRLICRSFGAGLTYTEMASSKAIFYQDQKTNQLLALDKAEKPSAVQIFGCEPKILAYTAQKLCDMGIDLIDINMGCPAPKIVRNNEGSALMRNPKLIAEIVTEVVRVSSVPVTIKIRKGWDDLSVNAVEIAHIAEDCGVSAITVHGRTREQFYSGVADWDIIKRVKEEVRIPVIGNGDIKSAKDAKALIEKTNCDGIMIARASQGNPWIFRNIIAYLEHGILLDEPSPNEKIDMAIEHLQKEVEYKGEYVGVREMRKHIACYLKGLHGSTAIKEQINRLDTQKDVITYLESYKYDLNSGKVME